jgi:beta-lactam-binding protein with PASTA domain
VDPLQEHPVDQNQQQQPSPFAVKDMLGREIHPGSVLLHTSSKKGTRLADVDEISITLSRSSPTKPQVKLKLTGRRNDPRFIGTTVTIGNPAQYVSLDVTPEVPATATTPAQPASMRVPSGGELASLLVGSAIN